MPIELKYAQSRGFLKATVTGRLIFNEIASAFEEITSSSEYPPNVDTLWDMQKADFSSTSEKMWHDIINVRKKYPKRSDFKLALVVSSDYPFGMLRMYEMLSDGELHRKLRVFRDMFKAEQWILQEQNRLILTIVRLKLSNKTLEIERVPENTILAGIFMRYENWCFAC